MGFWFIGRNYATGKTHIAALLEKYWDKPFRARQGITIPVMVAVRFTLNALPDDADWEYLREAQTMALALPNTGMAVAIESGMQDNIHPAYKQAVGDRLALAALKAAYGRNLVASGPTFKRATFKDAQAIVEFENVGAGLCARELDLDMGKIHLPANELRGFAVCGADQCFKWAKAVIQGNTVVCRVMQLAFGPDAKLGFRAVLFIPAETAAHKVPFPVIVHPSFEIKLAKDQPLDVMNDLAKTFAQPLERGMAVIAFYYQQCGHDKQANFRQSGFFPAYPDYDWGDLAAWAWGMSRCVDYLQTQPFADMTKIIAVGHSRLPRTDWKAWPIPSRRISISRHGSVI